jgi:hypothetical protein
MPWPDRPQPEAALLAGLIASPNSSAQNRAKCGGLKAGVLNASAFFNREAEMKMLIIAFGFAAITTASAQTSMTSMPRTLKVYNNSNGETIGTATTSDGRTLYLRDSKGELIGTIVINPDRTRTFFDPHGKIVDTVAGGNLKLPNE